MIDLLETNRRSHVGGLVLAVILLAVMAAMNLPYQYVEVGGTWIGAVEMPDTSEVPVARLPRMAGWPLNYWVRYDGEDRVEDRYWAPWKLGLNTALAIAAAAVVVWFITFRERRIRHSARKRRTKALLDVTIAVVILIVPGAVVAHQCYQSRQEQQLAYRLSGGANSYVSCWLPKPLAGKVPRSLIRRIPRVRHVHIIRADEREIAELSRLPSLARLFVYSGSFDASALVPLTDNHFFSALRLSNRTLEDEDLRVIGQLKWLTSLNLFRTNLDHVMLRRLDDLNHLSYVDLRHTALDLSQLGTPQWASSVTDLRLTRPTRGSTATLRIDGWPRLKRLWIRRMTVEPNPEVFEVRLANLEQLETLYLDRIQKHSLHIENLPRLSRIADGLSPLFFTMNVDYLVPGLMWCSELRLKQVASLTRVDCFVRDLTVLSIREARSLREVELGSYLTASLGSRIGQPADPELCQRWIRDLGGGDGPPSVSLVHLPLSEARLSHLGKNARIRHLRLIDCGLQFHQIQTLEAMSNLRTLDLGECELQADELTWLLETFPDLEDLAVNGSGLTRVDLSHVSGLRNLRTSILEQVDEFRLVDQPMLNGDFRLRHAPAEMEIQDARSIRGLAMEEPWPSTAQVSGLRDLEWFAAGGDAVDDRLMEVILQCRRLDQLTLAYPSVSPAKLKEIGQLTGLTMLVVPGADVTDDVTGHWHRLKSLWEVNLDDTRVSAGTIAWLSRMEPLRRLSLNRVPLDADALQALSEIRQVSELHLEGLPVTAELLQPILEAGVLEVLNLSGCQVDKDMINAIASIPSLKFLILRGCEPEPDALRRLAEVNPRLLIESGQVDDDQATGLLDQIRERFSSFAERTRRIAEGSVSGTDAELTVGSPRPREQLFGQLDLGSVLSLAGPIKTGRIDLEVFRNADTPMSAE